MKQSMFHQGRLKSLLSRGATLIHRRLEGKLFLQNFLYRKSSVCVLWKFHIERLSAGLLEALYFQDSIHSCALNWIPAYPWQLTCAVRRGVLEWRRSFHPKTPTDTAQSRIAFRRNWRRSFFRTKSATVAQRGLFINNPPSLVNHALSGPFAYRWYDRVLSCPGSLCVPVYTLSPLHWFKVSYLIFFIIQRGFQKYKRKNMDGVMILFHRWQEPGWWRSQSVGFFMEWHYGFHKWADYLGSDITNFTIRADI